MIGSKIDLLERFGACIQIIQYYVYAHRSFLLLTKLSKNSREMLDQYYDAVINCLSETRSVIPINESNIRQLLLPCDLFKFSINGISSKMIEIFSKFILNIFERRGWYYGQHFMHSKLCIHNIFVDSEFTQELLKYLEMSKSIEIINDKHCNKFKLRNEGHTLFDKISFKDKNNFIINHNHFAFPDIQNEDSQILESNINSNIFCRVFFIFLIYYTIDESLSILKDIGDLKIKIDNIHLNGVSIEESESLTNPEFFTGRVGKLSYSFKEVHVLSDNFFSNINKINPKALRLQFRYGLTGIFDIIKAITNVNKDVKLTFEHSLALNQCQLIFANAPIKIIQSNYEEPIYLLCENFTCYLELNKYENHYWFTSNTTDENYENETYIHISSSKEYCFENFTLINDDEENIKINRYFYTDSSISEKELEIIVSTKYLKMTNIRKNHLSTFISYNKNYEIIHELSNARTFLCSLNYSSEMKYLDKCLPIFPSKCMYSFLEYSKPDNQNELDIFLQKDFMDKLLYTMSHLKTACIFLDFILPKNHLSFIYDALQLPSIQNYILYIKLRFMNLSSALEVLDLLYNCVNIEFNDLYYISCSSISNPDEAIDQAKKSFINKRGVISKFIIAQDTNKD